MDWSAAIKQAGFTSDQEVARAMAEAPSWPKDDAPRNIRSIGNKVSDLKRGTLGWWCGAKGRKFRPALAEVLGVEAVDLDRAIDSASQGGADILPFDVFPELRPFDPAADDLPPGVPNELTIVARIIPRPTWWVAAPGAGRRMAAAWLRVRQHWTVVDADDWTDVEKVLVDGTRVFARLKTSSGVPDEPKLPLDASLIVAAPFEPPVPDDRHDRGTLRRVISGWRVLRNESPEEWAHDLVDWVDARLDEPAGFTREAALEMLDQPAILGLLSTPGDLLDLLAVLDHLGERIDTDPTTLFDAYIRLAGQRAGLSEPERRRLREHAWALLQGMTRMRLRHGHGPCLDEETWASLVQVPALSRDALWELADDARLPDKELRARLKHLSEPNGEDVVEQLRRIRLLRSVGEGAELSLNPPWLSALVLNVTALAMADEDAMSFGTLVVHPETSKATLQILYGELADGQTRRTGELLAATDTEPEVVAARALAQRAVGLALVAGHALPSALVRAAWNARRACSFARYRDFPPEPRVPPAHEQGDDGLLGTGAHLLAMLAIAEALPDRLDEQDEFVAAWRGGSDAARWLPHLDRIEAHESVRDGIYRLGRRLVDRAGPADHGQGLPQFQRPYLLARLSQGASIDLSQLGLRDVLQLRFPPETFEDACAAAGTTSFAVLSWCWSKWADTTYAEDPPPIAWLRSGAIDADHGSWPDQVGELWRVLPAEAMSERVCQFLTAAASELAWEHLGAEQRAAWVAWWSARPNPDLGQLTHLPDELFLDLYRTGAGVTAFFPHHLVWAAYPDEVTAMLLQGLGAPPVAYSGGRDSLAIEILYSVPSEHAEEVLDGIEELIARKAIHEHASRSLPGWLHSCVQRRTPGWRRAYRLLDQISPPSTHADVA